MMMSFNGTGRIIGPLIGAFIFYYLGYFFMFIIFSLLLGIFALITYLKLK